MWSGSYTKGTSWVLVVERLEAEASHPRALGPTQKARLWTQRLKRSSAVDTVVPIIAWVGGLPVVREERPLSQWVGCIPLSQWVGCSPLMGAGEPERPGVWVSLIRDCH